MSNADAMVSVLASLNRSNPQAKEIAREIAQNILGDSRLRNNFVDAGIIPAALRKLDESEDTESRVCYSALLRTLTVQKAFKADSQIQECIKRAQRELRELGALFVIIRALRFEGFEQNLWSNLSDTMTAVLHHMDAPSLPFNEVAVPFLLWQLSQSWEPWQVYSCASMLRSCLGIRGKHAPVDIITLEHALSAGCLPVLIEKLALCCGQDGNQPIASMLRALVCLPQISFSALFLDIVPALLANLASPQPAPSRFIDPDGEWSDELEYHRSLARILLHLVRAPNVFANEQLQSVHLHGTMTLLSADCIPLLVDRLWCKTSSKILSTMAARVESASCSQNGLLISRDDCERFFVNYSNALLTKLEGIPSTAPQRDGALHADAHAKTLLAFARSLADLSELSGGKKAILESNGGVAIIARFMRWLMVEYLKFQARFSLPYPQVGIRLNGLSRHGASIIVLMLSTLLNLVQLRRGTKGAVAAGIFHMITPALLVDTNVIAPDGLENSQQDQQQHWRSSRLHVLTAEILARVSSITKGQRQAVRVAPSIAVALCAHATQSLALLMPLVEVVGNIASTKDGLFNLAYCNAAPALFYVRELIFRRQQSPSHDDMVKTNNLAVKLHALKTLVTSQQMKISNFFIKVSNSCTLAASKCLIWPDGDNQTEFQSALSPKFCSLAVEAIKNGLILPGLCNFVTVYKSCGALMGMLIQRIGAIVDVSFRKNILECCVSKALNPRRLRFIQNTFGSRVAADCISIQTWVTSHDQTFAAARMIKQMLGEQRAADEVRNQPQTLEMVAAYLKDRMKLSKDSDADTFVRSAVSIFSPPLAILIIGEGGSEYVVLCEPERNQQTHFETQSGIESTTTLQAAESCHGAIFATPITATALPQTLNHLQENKRSDTTASDSRQRDTRVSSDEDDSHTMRDVWALLHEAAKIAEDES